MRRCCVICLNMMRIRGLKHGMNEGSKCQSVGLLGVKQVEE